MDYAKQYKMVEMLIDTVFPVIKDKTCFEVCNYFIQTKAMNDSWIKANETDYIAGASPYPTNEHMQGGVVIYNL